MIGMARRPFDPVANGWDKATYRPGDIRDRASVEELVEGADVVVHLAFVIVDDGGEGREINLTGSRNVFEAAVAAGAKRLVYTSSVAAYGFHRDLPDLITEDEPARGTDRHPYSADKAEVEAELRRGARRRRDRRLRLPPLHRRRARSDAPARHGPAARARPEAAGSGPLGAEADARRCARSCPIRASASSSSTTTTSPPRSPRPSIGIGEPGAYNLAGPGELTISDLAHELGWHAVAGPPRPTRRRRGGRGALPCARTCRSEATWIEAVRRPMLMDTARARRELRWMPHHDARETLRETIAAVRSRD